RNGQERSAPVGRAAGEDVGEVPSGGVVASGGLDLTLDDAEHPARADEGREGAVDEGLAAAPVPLGLVRGETGCRAVGEQTPQLLERGVVLHVEVTGLRVVALRLLVDHRVPDESALVVPGLAGG